MAMIATDIKGLLSINIKSRHDARTDQYNRIFMVKILLVSCIIMGISWFQDSITCIVPDQNQISGGFVSSACWIQGVYVYKEMINSFDDMAYFGIPKDMNHDGYYKPEFEKSGKIHPCNTKSKFGRESKMCEPMEKTFFLQYQWMPFLIASLAVVYYMPYIAFRSANSDLISLKNSIKGEDPSAEKIVKSYFNRRLNPPRTMLLRVLFNILIKILYICANLVALLGLDNLLNGEYIGYGGKWVKWSRLDNSLAYDYMGMRDTPKPGNQLLPPFGYCELYEAAKDIRNSLGNKHKFVCELSQNILYQYCLIVLWFAIIFGIVISVIGLIILLVHYAIGLFGVRAPGQAARKVFKNLTFRELEYLEFIRNKNMVLYKEVLDKLKEEMNDPNAPPMDNYSEGGRPSDTLPLYPSLPPKRDPYDEKGAGY